MSHRRRESEPTFQHWLSHPATFPSSPQYSNCTHHSKKCSRRKQKHTNTRAHTHTHTHTNTHTHKHTQNAHMHRHTHSQTHKHRPTHSRTQTYDHTYAHTHTHTHTRTITMKLHRYTIPDMEMLRRGKCETGIDTNTLVSMLNVHIVPHMQ